MNLRQLQSEVGAWSRRNFPNNKPYHPLLGLMEELGELCHAHLKEEQGIREVDPQAKGDAVADMVIYLCDYAERNDFKLTDFDLAEFQQDCCKNVPKLYKPHSPLVFLSGHISRLSEMDSNYVSKLIMLRICEYCHLNGDRQQEDKNI